jgi:hypothetical protein
MNRAVAGDAAAQVVAGGKTRCAVAGDVHRFKSQGAVVIDAGAGVDIAAAGDGQAAQRYVGVLSDVKHAVFVVAING